MERGAAEGNGSTPRPQPPSKSAPRSASTAAPKPKTKSKAKVAGAAAPTAAVAAPVVERPVGDDATVVSPVPAAASTAWPTTAPPEDQRSIPAPEEDDGSRQRRGRRGRRVRRVIRRIELWSVLKLSLVLYTCLYLAVLGALIVVWGLAYSSGQIENLQNFLADVGLENYRFYGDQMFRACAAIGAVGVLAGTIITVFTAALVNLISEITGGIRLIVIEEEPPTRR